jgi:hypothetical protein
MLHSDPETTLLLVREHHAALCRDAQHGTPASLGPVESSRRRRRLRLRRLRIRLRPVSHPS